MSKTDLDRAIEVTEGEIERFRQAIAEHDGIGRFRMIAEGISPVIVDACRCGLESQLTDLLQELNSLKDKANE